MKSSAFSLISLILFGMLGCNEPTKNINDTEKLRNYLLTVQKLSSMPSNGKIFVLTEEGCVPCNRAYMEIVQQIAERDSNIILVSASGAKLDIKNFLNDSGKNVLLDSNNVFGRLGLMNGSGLIVLKNSMIDTIIVLDSKHLQEQFEEMGR